MNDIDDCANDPSEIDAAKDETDAPENNDQPLEELLRPWSEDDFRIDIPPIPEDGLDWGPEGGR